MKIKIRKKILVKIPVIVLTVFFLFYSSVGPVLADTALDTYSDANKINSGSSSNWVVSGGQIKMAYVLDAGDGVDGAITIAVNRNINTDNMIAGRTCADGGDGVNYSVSSLTANTATLSSTPSAGCLAAGDDLILINLQGTSSASTNVGNYELFTISSISTNTITFTASKTKFYGNGAADDTNIGTATTNQRVMLQRVPNYTNVTVNSGIVLTASNWNGTKGGVLAFKANGTVTVTGTINANSLGYSGSTAIGTGAQAFCGAGGGTSTGGGNGGTGGGYVSLCPNSTAGSGTSGGSAGAAVCGGGGGGSGGGGGGGGGTTSESPCSPATSGGAGGPAGGGVSGSSTGGAGGNGGNGGGGGGGGDQGVVAELTQINAGGGVGGQGGGGGYGTAGASGTVGSGGVRGESYGSGAGNCGSTPGNVGNAGAGGATGGSGTSGAGGSGGSGTIGGTTIYCPGGGSGAGGGGGGGGGGTYGTADLSKVYFGAGGGKGGGTGAVGCIEPSGPVTCGGTGNSAGGTNGGNGGGVVFISGSTINVTGGITSNGANPGGNGGGGAGGSVRLQGDSLSLGTNLVTAAAGGNGGTGRIAINYAKNYFSPITNPLAYVTWGGGSTFQTSTTIQSTNLLSGITDQIDSIDNFTYTLSAKPSGTTATVQFSQDASTWKNSAGVVSGTDTLTAGTNTLGLSALGWSGANFYYKVAFTGGGISSPVLDDITANYTINGGTCDVSPGGDFTMTTNCAFSGNVNGVDNGNLTVAANKTLTVNAGQTIAWNPAKSIIIANGGSIAINTNSQLKQTNLWVSDSDGDGWWNEKSVDGTATGTTIVAGKYGNARSFNGTSDIATIPDTPGLRLSTSGLTWEAWFNASDISTYRSITSKDGNYILRIDSPAEGNKISCFTYLNGAWQARASSTNVPTTGQWIHAACTWDGSNLRIYVNGIQNGNPVSNSGTPNALTNPYWIGGGNYFAGSIDDVRIYNYARSASQIAEDMNSASIRDITGTLPILWQRFDESTGSLTSNYAEQLAMDSQPASGYVRRNTVIKSVHGNSRDGSITIASNTNINTATIGSGRTVPDGAQYVATALGTNTATLGTTPVGMWYMNETSENTCSGGQDACDSSANGNHGTATGTSIVAGKYGNARSFNGSERATIAKSASLTFTTALTIEAWIRPTDCAHGASGHNTVVAQENGLLLAFNNSCQVANYVSAGGTWSAADGGGGTVPTNQWSHLAMTWDGSTIRSYLNGNLISGSGTSKTGSWTNSANNYYLGARIDCCDQTLNGLIDDVRIYNYARSANQIVDDMYSWQAGLAAGDDVVLMNLQGDSTNYTSVGSYEFLKVQSVSLNTVTFSSNILKTYGVAGNSNLTGQKIVLQRVPNYNNVTINSGVSLTANAWNGTKGGVLAFRANGTVTVTGTINANGLGYLGSTAIGTGAQAFCGAGGGTSPAGGNGGTGGPYASDGAFTQGQVGFSGGSAGAAVCGGGAGGSGGGGGGGRGSSAACCAGPGAVGGSAGGAVSGSATGGAGGNGGNGGGGGGGGYHNDTVTQTNAGGGAGGGGGGGGYGTAGALGTAGGGGGGGGSSGSCGSTPGFAGNGGAGGATGGSGTSGAGGSGGAGGQGGEHVYCSGGGGGAAGGGGGGGGGTYGTADLSKVYFGAGGGKGGGTGAVGCIAPDVNNCGGAGNSAGGTSGGNGGGIVIIFANTINITGSINANAASPGGNGGGGAGGSTLLKANTVSVGTNLVTAAGGTGGGAGGSGRIAVGAGTLSGTTNPTYTSISAP